MYILIHIFSPMHKHQLLKVVLKKKAKRNISVTRGVSLGSDSKKESKTKSFSHQGYVFG